MKNLKLFLNRTHTFFWKDYERKLFCYLALFIFDIFFLIYHPEWTSTIWTFFGRIYKPEKIEENFQIKYSLHNIKRNWHLQSYLDI